METLIPCSRVLKFFVKAFACSLLSIGLFAQEPTQVPYQRILRSADDPGNWLTYAGNYYGQRYSTLTQITPANVANLKPLWVYQKGDMSKWEVTPIVVDGVMFITENPNIVTALDAKTGRVIWTYRRPVPEDVIACCGASPRGVTVLGDAVYLGTLDSHLVCIDASTGKERWDKVVIDYRLGYAMTGAPLALKDKIIVGHAGGEYGVRGFIAAYDAKTGEQAWRFHTIPGPGEPGHETWPDTDFWKNGGGSTWLTGTFDPELNLIYWTTSNPGSSYNGDKRKGDNLYCNSVVALDADTGKLKWHFQYTPHDLHDWDSNQVPVLFDANVGGKPRKLLGHINRNGFYYLLDRTTGEFITGREFIKQTWAKGLDDHGRPIVIPGTDPTPEGVLVYPGLGGGVNWPGPAYNPLTGMLYVNTRENYGQIFVKREGDYRPGGATFTNGGGRNVFGEEPYGSLKAIEAISGKVVWEHKMQSSISVCPVLATVTGLVFSGTAEGEFYALDARTGQSLWHFRGGPRVQSGAVTYLHEGKQRIAVGIGGGLYVFGL
jgi:alcohol dehydrogenase (cytochrome c)